ncbi:hypothetical protein PIB30_011897 [Stylosanthes scabra]|uniref:Uncharacterized protein n=1 Tax=Stylosanthes scabra TaxID=79078 RepID=A0ABU6V966_9FABA|nr:hypothetical protein [Stylosanthes scabra]
MEVACLPPFNFRIYSGFSRLEAGTAWGFNSRAPKHDEIHLWASVPLKATLIWGAHHNVKTMFLNPRWKKKAEASNLIIAAREIRSSCIERNSCKRLMAENVEEVCDS